MNGRDVEGTPMTMEELAVYAVAQAAQDMLEAVVTVLDEREPGLGHWLLERMAFPPPERPQFTVIRP